jgi:uncharacterized protein
MTTIIRMLHDPSSQMMGLLLNALREGEPCLVDVSQMRGTQGYVLLASFFGKSFREIRRNSPELSPQGSLQLPD